MIGLILSFMSSVAVIPVRGRLQLIPYTIKQALKVVDKVICITTESYELEYCTGALAAKSKSVRLGRMWNLGFRVAKDFDPDYVLFIGSSDWVSENWMDVMAGHSEGYDVVGVKGYNLLHLDYSFEWMEYRKAEKMFNHAGAYKYKVNYNNYKLGEWRGYSNHRKGEPIGIGRVLNRDFLKRIDYKPFDDDERSGMDYHMINLAKNYKIVTEDIKCLAVSTSLWGNMHSFFDEAEEIEDNGFLDKWFPGTKELMGWTEANLTNSELRNGMQAMFND